MKTKSLLHSLVGTFAAALACCLPLRAQNRPNIVWQTNAFGTTPVLAMAFSPNGSLLASGSGNGRDGIIKLWNSSVGSLVQTMTISRDTVISLAFSPDGSQLASGGAQGSIRLWDTTSGALARILAGRWEDVFRQAVAFSPDGAFLLVGTSREGSSGVEGTFQLIRLSDGTSYASYEDPPHHGPLNSVDFAPDSLTFATAGGDSIVKVWPVMHGLTENSFLKAFSDHSAAVNSLSYLPNGTEFASGSADTTVAIRPAAGGLVQHRLQNSNGVWRVALAPDGKTLLTSSGENISRPGNDIKFWRIADEQLLLTYDQDTLGVRSLATSKDGKYFAYGRSDGTVVLAFMPLWINDVSLSGNKITLRWQGGSGLYRVQARSHVDRGRWHYLGPATTNTTFTHPVRNRLFYRVVSLPNP